MRTTIDTGIGNLPPTPPFVKKVLILTVILTLAGALLDPLFSHFAGKGILYYLTLNQESLNNFFLWQPITYLFVQNSYGINLGLLINLLFETYIIWWLGSSLAESLGERTFLRTYFASGIGAGIVGALYLSGLGFSGAIGTPLYAIYGIFLLWTMLYPDAEVLLFFLFPLKTRWLLLIVFAGALLIAISQGDILNLCMTLTAFLVSYLFATIKHQLRTPFPLTYPIDDRLAGLANYFANWNTPKTNNNKGKIIDIHTGQSRDEERDADEEFVDEMLAKISKSGEQSLSAKERTKLDQIAKKKKL